MPLLLAVEETASDGVLNAEIWAIVLIAIAAIVAVAARFFKVPFTVLLVVAGLVMAALTEVDVNLSKDLILGVFVPPLVFEATMKLPWRRLRNDLASILTLAIGGTLIGTFVIGAIVRPFLDVPWPAALAFGALISATDPVAVISLFRSLGVSKRLTTLVEGESLFNDGAAIVVFNLAVAAAVVDAPPFSLGGAVGEFVLVAFGGLAVGIALGYVVSTVVLKNLDDHLVETAITVALAFGSYLVAEEFGVIVGIEGLQLSGILAVVAAGIVVGELGLRNTSPPTRLTLENFWEFLSFTVNSFVFLLIGLRIHVRDLVGQLDAVVVAIAAILLARALVVYGTMLVQNRIRATRYVSTKYQHVLYWGGLRGAVSLALALTLTGSFDDEVARVLELATFGVVLFTLLFQGTTINLLIRRLGLGHRSQAIIDQQRYQAVIYSKRAGRRELERLQREGMVLSQVWEPLDNLYDEQINADRRMLDRHFQRNPGLETSMFLQARSDAINAERSAVLDASRRGLISNEIAEEVSGDLAHRLAALEFIRARLGAGQEIDTEPEALEDGE
ncbi:MAG: Na+/H+ antiporter [Acidobacteria bacterium]|nr:Na+/H+ antiporter [Acidobacteriota bacterium]